MSVQDQTTRDDRLEYVKAIVDRERARAAADPALEGACELVAANLAAKHGYPIVSEEGKLTLSAIVELLQKMDNLDAKLDAAAAASTLTITPIAAPTMTRFKDIVVAVHGIGQQIRYSTVRSVATRLAGSEAMRGNSPYRPIARQPLGYFHSDVKGITSVVVVDDAPELRGDLKTVGFAEVFWADIPDKVLKEGSTLEETKAWGRTVVARAQSLWERGRPGLPPDFSLAAEVLDEIIETVYVLENLLFLADKAGLFKFDLREVLEAYLGDVQIVAEFANYRKEIVTRFHQAMEHIYSEQKRIENGDVRLHIVAHSEGTVVSFLGLLQALSGTHCTRSGSEDVPTYRLETRDTIPEWVTHVHGYMTIGSPIDKHLLLWERMWSNLNPGAADAVLKPGQIKWRNYYDYGDPIGFKLDTVRDRLRNHWHTNVFEFDEKKHDIGFARYMLPGKAHNDYWDDGDVFEHFVRDVVKTPPQPVKAPKSKPLVAMLSPTIPYALSFLLLFTGVYLLDKAVLAFMYPFDDAQVKHVLITRLGVEPTATIDRAQVFINTFGIAALLGGMTLLARFPRLAPGVRWIGYGLVAFVAGCVLYAASVSDVTKQEIGGIFAKWARDYSTLDATLVATLGTCLLALAVGVFGAWIARRSRRDDEDRRERWLMRGTRPLIVCGAFAIGLIVATQVFPDRFGLQADVEPFLSHLTPEQIAALDDGKTGDAKRAIVRKAGFDEGELRQLFAPGNAARLRNLDEVKPLLMARPPVWPVLLAGA
ncbi:MAG TPA: hypothetical protein VGP15_00310, partial [Burkholderiales bacterium]|nr:hypothetical protein [Burkholderiales bacterium]